MHRVDGREIRVWRRRGKLVSSPCTHFRVQSPGRQTEESKACPWLAACENKALRGLLSRLVTHLGWRRTNRPTDRCHAPGRRGGTGLGV